MSQFLENKKKYYLVTSIIHELKTFEYFQITNKNIKIFYKILKNSCTYLSYKIFKTKILIDWKDDFKNPHF